MKEELAVAAVQLEVGIGDEIGERRLGGAAVPLSLCRGGGGLLKEGQLGSLCLDI